MNISDEKLNVHVHNQYGAYENKTKFVAILTTVTMAVEITFGYLTNSMALLPKICLKFNNHIIA